MVYWEGEEEMRRMYYGARTGEEGFDDGVRGRRARRKEVGEGN